MTAGMDKEKVLYKDEYKDEGRIGHYRHSWEWIEGTV